MGSGKRGGAGNADKGICNLWSICLLGCNRESRVLKHQVPSSKQEKFFFVIEGHAPLKLCPIFKFIESKASSAITRAVNKIYCLMMDCFCRLELICLRYDLWDWGENTKYNLYFCCTERFHCVLLRLGSYYNCRGHFLDLLKIKHTLLTF